MKLKQAAQILRKDPVKNGGITLPSSLSVFLRAQKFLIYVRLMEFKFLIIHHKILFLLTGIKLASLHFLQKPLKCYCVPKASLFWRI